MLTWGEKVLSQIEEVSMDMTGNYKSLVKKICPNAEVTVDRFHVTKMIHEELNQARISQKQTAKSLKLKERVKLFNGLKGSKSRREGEVHLALPLLLCDYHSR
jgi:transposase